MFCRFQAISPKPNNPTLMNCNQNRNDCKTLIQSVSCLSKFNTQFRQSISFKMYSISICVWMCAYLDGPECAPRRSVFIPRDCVL